MNYEALMMVQKRGRGEGDQKENFQKMNTMRMAVGGSTHMYGCDLSFFHFALGGI